MLPKEKPVLCGGFDTGNAQTEREQKVIQRFVAEFKPAKRRCQPRRKVEQERKFPVETRVGFHVRKT